MISIVADALEDQPLKDNVLYLSEEGFDLDFSNHRALQRNRIIHSMADKTFIAQCALGKGGTWSGTCHNLRFGLSAVLCYADGSAACWELENRGAISVTVEMLGNIHAIKPNNMNFFDR